jgi:hypothetical protein
MLTDTEARNLLHQAADTIEIGPAAPFVEPPRRTPGAVVVLAAATAVLVLAVGAAVWRSDRTTPVDHPQGPVTVPSVLGYPTGAAMELLRSAGLEPRLEKRLSCTNPGRAIRTKPWAGTRVRAGSPVVLVAVPTNTRLRCPYNSQELPRSVAWQLADLARGLPRSPFFADHVRLSVNDQPSITMSASQAADPTSWPTCDSSPPVCEGSALDLIKTGVDFALNSDGYFVQPELLVTTTSENGRSFAFRTGHVSYGNGEPLPWSVSVKLTSGGAISAVHLDFPGRHHFIPAPGKSDRTVVGSDASGIGQRFVEFALGRSDTLPVDTPVRLYLGNVYRRTLTAEQAVDPRAWRTCVLYAASGCPPSALRTIGRYVRNSGKPVRVGGPGTAASPCLARSGPTPTDTGGTRRIVLTPSGNTDCLTGFWIEVWVNDVGQIVAVNELLAEP